MNINMYQVYKQIDKLSDKKLCLGLSKKEQQELEHLWHTYHLFREANRGEVRT